MKLVALDVVVSESITEEVAKIPAEFTLTKNELSKIMTAYVEKGACLTEKEVVSICEKKAHE